MSKEIVNTKRVNRRACSYSTVGELRADLDQLEESHNAGTLTSTGNWTAGMNFEHVAKAFEFSFDGFPISVAAPVRWAFVLFFKKKLLSGAPFPAGLKPPPRFLIKGDLNAPLPDPAVSFHDGLERLRAVLRRLENGERFTLPNPAFGKLTHEQALTLQLRHAELHMGFMNMKPVSSTA